MTEAISSATQVLPVLRRKRRQGRRALLAAVGIIGFLIVWEAAPRLGLIDTPYFPTLVETVAAFG